MSVSHACDCPDRTRTPPPVAIVVPVYNARSDVQRCVESILRRARGDWRLIIVDDASTDAALVEYLRQCAADQPRIELLHNERNLGFVATANRGMRAAVEPNARGKLDNAPGAQSASGARAVPSAEAVRDVLPTPSRQAGPGAQAASGAQAAPVAQDAPAARVASDAPSASGVRACDAGLGEARRGASAGRDVVLLNSDTIVPENFIEKLAACAYTKGRPPAIVSPFTNNGTICSIPEFCQDNVLPGDTTFDEYAEFIAAISLRHRPELVTAVGFCMYIPQAVFRRIGYFDEASFGRGFGEENDFCERAKAAGFEIRLCDDLFVAHLGSASFGKEASELQRINSRTLDRLHPRYFADVAAFCQSNPLRELHANVRFHLKRRCGRRYPAMLFLLHASPFAQPAGGTEHVVRDLVAHLALPRSLVVFPEADRLAAAEIFDGRWDDALLYEYRVESPPAMFQHHSEAVEAWFSRLLDSFEVGAAHLHHLLYWPVGLWRSLHDRGIPFAFTIHDYYSVCPSWNLLNVRTGRRCACTEASPDAAHDCITALHDTLSLRAPDDIVGFLSEHRAEFGKLLAHAAAVFAPSQSAVEIVRRAYPSMPAGRVIEHGYDPPPTAPKNRHAPSTSPAASSTSQQTESPSRESSAVPPTLRVALLGQIAYPIKGAEEYLGLLESLRDAPIDWHVFGDVDVYGYRRRLEQTGLGDRLHLHGAYRREDVVDLLQTNAIDVTLILPRCDETFCYTLSETWLAGVPAVVSKAGALPERCRRSGAGVVVEDAREAAGLLRRFVADRRLLEPLREAAIRFRHVTLEDNARQHATAYGELHRIVVTPKPHGLAFAKATARLGSREQAAAVSATADATCDFGEEDRALFKVYYETLQSRTVQPPPPAYHRRWWYPHYLRFRDVLPPTWRRAAKRIYLRIHRNRPVRVS